MDGIWYALDVNRNVVALPKGAYPDKKHADNKQYWQVGYDEVGDYRISTVFLQLDHRFGSQGPPIVFETMVFPKDEWGEIFCQRYCTWAEAEAGHISAVEQVKNGEIK